MFCSHLLSRYRVIQINCVTLLVIFNKMGVELLPQHVNDALRIAPYLGDGGGVVPLVIAVVLTLFALLFSIPLL